MSQEIVLQHSQLIVRFQAIEAFVETKYTNNQRATLKDLARKIKIPVDTLVYELNLWLNYAVRHEASANMIHKLGLFYSETHVAPKEFRDIKFTSEERRRMHAVSKQWELPGYTYIKLMKDLMLHNPEMKERIIEQLKTTAYSAFSTLANLDLHTKTVCLQFDNWEKYATPLMVGNGNTPIFRYNSEEVDVWMHWARKTVEQHEAHKAIDVNNQEIICLARTDETVEQRAARKDACKLVNEFVKRMAVMGLILTKVTTRIDFDRHTTRPGDSKPPVLHFTNPNDAMVDIHICLETMGGYGKFILN